MAGRGQGRFNRRIPQEDLMGEIVNLRRTRKAKARAAAASEAEANRLKFGRSRTDREAVLALLDVEARRLDGHKRDLSEDSTESHGD